MIVEDTTPPVLDSLPGDIVVEATEVGGAVVTFADVTATDLVDLLDRKLARLPGRGGETLDCGNAGTAMRLLIGALAGRPAKATLVGDASLTSRPMERVAAPLCAIGARVVGCAAAASITTVLDVPDDQGGFVYVNFVRSGHDDTLPGRSEMYTVQRQSDGVWVTVATSGAYGDHTYSVLANTQGDGAALWTTPFRVIAHMD